MSLFYIWIFEGIKQTKYNVFNVVLPIPVNAKLINSQLKLLLEAKKKKKNISQNFKAFIINTLRDLQTQMK